MLMTWCEQSAVCIVLVRTQIILMIYNLIETYLLAQLEDSQGDGDDEREEGQLEGVPCLQSKNTDRQWDEGHGFKEHEHEDWDDDLL